MESGSQFPKDCSNNNTDVIETAAEAGRILLENGSEISRVEETMRRITTSLGDSGEHFFTMGNGIFASNHDKAVVRYIPIKSSRLDKIVEVADLSHKIRRHTLSLEEVRAELSRIDKLPNKPVWEQYLAVMLACFGFGGIFASSFMDCLAAATSGIILWTFVMFFGSRYLSKALNNISASIIGTACCMAFQGMGFGDNLGNMIVSTLILLIPGVAFTNGLRDIANEDYLSGVTRILDSLMVFFCLSLGASLVFIAHSQIMGGMIMLDGPAVSQDTYPVAIQAMSGFLGTVSFAILFGVQRKYYPIIGVVGMLSWVVYILAYRHTGLGIWGASLLGTSVTAFSAIGLARKLKCPSTIFFICGNFPLIPGGGIFWTVYYAVSGQMRASLHAGLTAFEITVAIVLAMIIASNVFKRNAVKGLAQRK